MNKRTIFLIIIGLIILLALGGGLYYLSHRQTQESTNSGLGPLKITKVIDERVVAPVPAFNNSSVWYFNSAGRLFKANVDGSNPSEFPLPTLPTGTLSQVLWPQSSSDFIALIRSSTGISKVYYDSTNSVFINLAANVQWVDWLPDSKRVIYVWQSGDKKSQQLVMANPDGSGFKTIANLFYPDLALKAGPSGKIALMYRTAITGDTNKIYATDLDSGEVVTLVDTGKNLAAKWLPNGNAFLYSQSAAVGTEIYLYDLASHKSADLNLNTSLDDVVVDSTSKTAYAAVPNSDNSGVRFVRIDLTTGTQTDYFTPDSNTNVSSLLLVGNTVYFVNSSDGKLYDISN